MGTETKSLAVKKGHLEELGELLTVEELAAFLKVKKTWVYGRVHSKTMPFPVVKVGHYPRFPVEGVLKFLESQTRKGTAA